MRKQVHRSCVEISQDSHGIVDEETELLIQDPASDSRTAVCIVGHEARIWSLVSIHRQSRWLYGCWPLKGAFSQPSEAKARTKAKASYCCLHCRSTGNSRENILPEFSKFYCHPGRAGGSPFWNRRSGSSPDATPACSPSTFGARLPARTRPTVGSRSGSQYHQRSARTEPAESCAASIRRTHSACRDWPAQGAGHSMVTRLALSQLIIMPPYGVLSYHVFVYKT